MNIAGATDIGLCRSENQDNFRAGRADERTYWLVMCDGMGGMSFGGEASRIATEHLEKEFIGGLADCDGEAELRAKLLSGLQQCNELICQAGEKAQVKVAMGTTVVAVAIRNNCAHIVHAGDSRAYLISRRGAIKQITKDHSMVQELVDNGSITAEQAQVHPSKNIITSALGIERDPVVDYNVLKLYRGDTLLVCSDGLTDMVDERTIRDTVKTEHFFDIPNKLIELAKLNGGADNITVVLARAE